MKKQACIIFIFVPAILWGCDRVSIQSYVIKATQFEEKFDKTTETDIEQLLSNLEFQKLQDWSTQGSGEDGRVAQFETDKQHSRLSVWVVIKPDNIFFITNRNVIFYTTTRKSENLIELEHALREKFGESNVEQCVICKI